MKNSTEKARPSSYSLLWPCLHLQSGVCAHADAEADVPVKRHPIQVKISMGFLRQAVLSQDAEAVSRQKKAAILRAILNPANT